MFTVYQRFIRDLRGIYAGLSLVLWSWLKTERENPCSFFLQILLKLEKTKEDKAAEDKRNELLKFLNASFD